MEGGILTVAVLAIMPVLFCIFPELSGDFRRLSPVEQNLTRAGNGFALMVLSAAAFWWLPRLRAEFNHVDAVIANPGAHWAVITGTALFLFGLLRFVSAARQCRGCGDWTLTSRAFLTMAFGLGGAWFLWGKQSAQSLSNFWLAVGWFLLLVMCFWWTLTGFIRLVLLNWPQGSGARAQVGIDIEASEFNWDAPPRPRHWWQFWQGGNS